MKYKTFLFLAVLCALTGCQRVHRLIGDNGLWHDQTDDYLQAKAYPALFVPEPLTRQPASEQYAVPSIPTPEDYQVDLLPPDLRS